MLFLFRLQRRRRCLPQAPAPERPRNSKARRMYARLLFVVVDVFGPQFCVLFPPIRWAVPELRLGMAGSGGYTHAP